MHFLPVSADKVACNMVRGLTCVFFMSIFLPAYKSFNLTALPDVANYSVDDLLACILRFVRCRYSRFRFIRDCVRCLFASFGSAPRLHFVWGFGECAMRSLKIVFGIPNGFMVTVLALTSKCGTVLMYVSGVCCV